MDLGDLPYVPISLTELKSVPINPNNRERRRPQIDNSLEIFNGLSVPVTIVYRSGLKTELKPTMQSEARDLIFRVRVRSDSETGFSVRQGIDLMKVNPRSNIRKSSGLYEASVADIPRHGYCESMCEYYICYEELMVLNGSAYIEELDIIVSTLPLKEAPNFEDNRYSPFAEYNEVSQLHYDFGAMVSFIIVDNLGTIGPMYVNYFNTIYRLDSITSPNLKSGVYVRTNGKALSGSRTTSVEERLYTVEEAKEAFAIFSTYAEAKNSPSAELEKKHRLMEMEMELLNMRHEANLYKEQITALEFEREMLKKKMDVYESEIRDRIEREQTERKQRMEEERADRKEEQEKRSSERKDFYEERSQDRKDKSEFFKLLPTFIAAITALISVIKIFT